MKFFLVFAVIAVASAQQQWTGPRADHQLGLPPRDTPAVATAKVWHNNAFQDQLKVLPPLPAERIFLESNLPADQLIALQRQAIDQINLIREQQIYALGPNARLVSSVPPTNFAEEIPRSPFGETPEVYQARLDHLRKLQEIRAHIS